MNAPSNEKDSGRAPENAGTVRIDALVVLTVGRSTTTLETSVGLPEDVAEVLMTIVRAMERLCELHGSPAKG